MGLGPSVWSLHDILFLCGSSGFLPLTRSMWGESRFLNCLQVWKVDCFVCPCVEPKGDCYCDTPRHRMLEREPVSKRECSVPPHNPHTTTTPPSHLPLTRPLPPSPLPQDLHEIKRNSKLLNSLVSQTFSSILVWTGAAFHASPSGRWQQNTPVSILFCFFDAIWDSGDWREIIDKLHCGTFKVPHETVWRKIQLGRKASSLTLCVAVCLCVCVYENKCSSYFTLLPPPPPAASSLLHVPLFLLMFINQARSSLSSTFR